MFDEIWFRVLSGSKGTVAQLLYPNAEFYGLELVERSGGLLKRGSIYVILSRMAKHGLVVSRLVPAPDGARGPARRMYKLTANGFAMFEAHDAARVTFRARLGGVIS